MRNEPDCSIIIVNWNGEKFLRRCLPSIAYYINLSKYRFQIYVVDNASVDESQDYIRSHFPEINLIQNTSNLGFAKANNIAMRQCRSRYILLANNDVELIYNVLDEMIDFMDENKDVGVAGCQLIDSQNSPQQSHGRFHIFNEECTDLLVSIFYPLLRKRKNTIPYLGSSSAYEVDYVSGAFFLIRESLVTEIGMLDEAYFFYCEEMDFCYRVKQETDYRILLLPYLKVIHYGGGSSSSQNRWKYDLQLLKSKLHFAEKFYPKIWLIVYRMLSIISIIIRLMRKVLKRITHHERFEASQWKFYRDSLLLYLKL